MTQRKVILIFSDGTEVKQKKCSEQAAKLHLEAALSLCEPATYIPIDPATEETPAFTLEVAIAGSKIKRLIRLKIALDNQGVPQQPDLRQKINTAYELTSDSPSPWDVRADVDGTKIEDGIEDLGIILFKGYYSSTGYPWQNPEGARRGFSVARLGRDRDSVNNLYTEKGASLRDAIRHAEIIGDPVPDQAYEQLANERQPETQALRERQGMA